MAAPHVLAIGLQHGGHTPNFLQWLAGGWAGDASTGTLTLLVSASFAEEYPAAAQAIAQAHPARITLLSISTQEQAHTRTLPPGLRAWPGVRRHTALRVQRWREWELCRRYAVQTGADHALYINLDFYQLAATWNPDFPCGFSGIFHNLMLHYPTQFAAALPPKLRLRAALQAWSMRRFLARSRAATLFCLDPYVVDTLNTWPGRHRAVALPTPARPFDAAADPGILAELRRRHAIDPTRRIFLMLGGIGPRRGIYPVLDALARLDQQAAQQVCLLMVGRQSDKVRLAQALAAAQATTPAQIVTHDAFIAESEIGSYYALADVVLATHVSHVGTSISLVQAAAASKPVIASDFGLLGEFTRRYGLGLTVDTGDPSAIAAAFQALLARPSDQFIDRPKAQQFAQTHSVDAFVAMLLTNL